MIKLMREKICHRRHNMNFKRLLFLVLVLVTVFTLAACKDKDPDEPDTPDTPPDVNTTYTVTFAGEGVDIPALTIASGKTAIAPAAPTKNGYTFKGWMNGSEAFSFDTAITADITLTPSWEPTVYTITFMDGNTVLSDISATYTIESPDITLSERSKEHYNFMGWYLDAGFTKSIIKIAKGTTGDLVLYAQFAVKNYGITYELGEGGVNADGNPSSYNIDSIDPANPILFAAPTMEGYDFKGWYLDAAYTTPFEGITAVTGNIVVFAKWEKSTAVDPDPGPGGDNPPPVENKKYNIEYYVDGVLSNDFEPKEYTSGTALALPTLEKEYYAFAGWYTSPTFEMDTKVDSITDTTTGNLKLYAKFAPISFNITYYVNGGENSQDNPDTYTVEDTFRFASPEKEGYEFAGWFTSPAYNVQISSVAGRTGDLVLYAKWVQISSGGITTPEDEF